MVVSTYCNSVPNADKKMFVEDKTIVVDSKVLMFGLDNEDEAYYVCGIINSPIVVKIIDGYAINTNRGIDVLRYIGIPQFDSQNTIHRSIASLSKQIHELVKEGKKYSKLEKQLSNSVKDLYCKRKTSKRKARP